MSEREIFALPVPVSDSDHVRGLDSAPVTVVKYGDFESVECHRSHRLMRKAAALLESKMKFVYRHFPLINVHSHALLAAEAAEAAAAQGKFWEMHDRLFGNPAKLEEKHLKHHAKKIGLDTDRFDQELTSRFYSATVQASYRASLLGGITGSPTFYINGVRYDATSDTQRLIEYISTL